MVKNCTRKIVIEILCVFLIIISPFALISAYAENYVMGDMDDDGEITADDGRIMLRASAQIIKANPKQCALADINFDRIISASEARKVLRVSAKIEPATNVAFIYLPFGFENATVKIENQLDYDIFDEAIAEWNNSETPAEIIQVSNSGHGYVTSGAFDEPWYGLYTPIKQKSIWWGRATKFKIELNRTTLDSDADSDDFVLNVLVHELGHVFCLGDNPSDGNLSIMNHSRDRAGFITPTYDDLVGVNYAYYE